MTPAIVLARARVSDVLELTKPRVILMVLLTTTVGFYLGSTGGLDLVRLCHTVMGAALAAAGALALNQFLERDLDVQMDRTRLRPLPDGRLDPGVALGFGSLLTALGLVYLTVLVNALAGLLTAVIAVSYLGVYTPLKQLTSFCTVAGAVPGALPPLVGFAGARGGLGADAWVLFGIMFLWQIPHTLAIGRLYREDYARANVRMLPVVKPEGASTGRQAVLSCLALLVVAALPVRVGLAGHVYLGASLVLGLAFFGCALALAVRREAGDARRLLFASLLYLPLLLVAMAVDKVPG